MGSTRASIRYAKAILGLAQDKGSVDVVLNDMKDVITTLSESKELRLALKSPVIKGTDKKAVLDEMFKAMSGETKGLINILVENKRVEILGNVATSFVDLYNASKGVQVATVTTAVAMTPELEAKVLAKVTELTGSTDVKLDSHIDESIIGGFILRVGDSQYNASISSQLGKLKREFSNSL